MTATLCDEATAIVETQKPMMQVLREKRQCEVRVHVYLRPDGHSSIVTNSSGLIGIRVPRFRKNRQ